MTDAVLLTPQRKARLESGLSIRQLEMRTGINRGMLSLFERGRYLPTLAEQQRIASALEQARADQSA